MIQFKQFYPNFMFFHLTGGALLGGIDRTFASRLKVLPFITNIFQLSHQMIRPVTGCAVVMRSAVGERMRPSPSISGQNLGRKRDMSARASRLLERSEWSGVIACNS